MSPHETIKSKSNKITRLVPNLCQVAEITIRGQSASGEIIHTHFFNCNGSGRKHEINRKLKFKDHSTSELEVCFNSKE